MTLQYEVYVEGLVINGHPHQLLFTNKEVAARVYDKLCEKYPTYNIAFYEYEKKELKRRDTIVSIPKACPRGHTGLSDGQSVLKQGFNGMWSCKVCGELWNG